MVVISKPTEAEVEEFLDAVAKKHDLYRILPLIPRRLLPYRMLMGWVFLFYDETTLDPLFYLWFDFDKKSVRPWMHFGDTGLQRKKSDFLTFVRYGMQIVRAHRNGVKVSISNERIAGLARAVGFRRHKKAAGVWYYQR